MLKWQAQFEGAGDTSQLLDMMNDHLASWTPGELANLPPACRPTRIRGSEDISFWLERLTIAYCEAQAETSSQHRRLLAFFIAAEERQKQFAGAMRAIRHARQCPQASQA